MQNEIAGRETGRQHRFRPESEASIDAKRKKEAAERVFRSQLEALLADPIYRAKYDDAFRVLRHAERATESAYDELIRLITEAEAILDNMKDRAARLPDGTLVFKDANGIVRRTNGSEVDDVLAGTVVWTWNEPSYEAYRDQQRQLSDLREELGDVERYRQKLGSARDRLTDEDNPPTLDELDDIRRDIEDNAPGRVFDHMRELEAPEVSHTETSAMAIPKLPIKP